MRHRQSERTIKRGVRGKPYRGEILAEDVRRIKAGIPSDDEFDEGCKVVQFSEKDEAAMGMIFSRAMEKKAAAAAAPAPAVIEPAPAIIDPALAFIDPAPALIEPALAFVDPSPAVIEPAPAPAPAVIDAAPAGNFY